jgi:hypothetical protein
MGAQDFPLLNGIVPSWADVAITFTALDGPALDNNDLSELSWKDELDIGFQKIGGRIIARGSGDVKQEASCRFAHSGWTKLKKILADMAPQRGDRFLIGLVGFNVLVQYTPPGVDGSPIYKVEINGCRVSGRDFAGKEGSELFSYAIPLNPIEIIEYDELGRKIVLR